MSTLSKIALYYRDPKDQLNAAIELVYPKHWLDQKSENPKYDTNKDFAIHGFISHVVRSQRQKFLANIGQTAACLRHHVSDDRLLRIKQTGLPILIVTGTIDNLVRPESSYHLKRVLDNARLEVFEGSGHAIPEEQPARYNTLLVEHFDHSNGFSHSSSSKL
ncbi:hypothetical protein K501DRAFT_72666 [Backusella circina FSU 941]|nr:hypothetical protein K501DRAFT_72666 [Backusella circina FSU 941]